MESGGGATIIDQLIGPYGVVALLMYAVIHLYRENTEMRKKSMELLEKYQERDEEERKLRLAEEAEQRRQERQR